ncbi:MAG TPA: DMT family transporter [Chroococcidiopsis sp.]
MQLHHTSGRWQLGLALALSTVSLWGVLPIALDIVLEVVDPYTLIWFRFLMAFSLVGVLLLTKKQVPTWKTLRSTRLDLLAIATLFLALNYFFFTQGLLQTSPTNSQVIIQLAPVFLGIGAIAIFRERYTTIQWIGLGILTSGMSLFFDDQWQAMVAAPNQYLMGSGAIAIAALVWAVYALAQKQLLQQLPSTVIMWFVYGGSALLFSPMASPSHLLSLTPLQWAMLLFSGLNTVLAYGAFAEALDHWEASRVSAVLSLTPVVTLISVAIASSLFPRFVTAEIISHWGILGALLVVIGSFSVALGKRVRPTAAIEE